MSNNAKKEIFFSKEIIFNKKGQIILKKKFLPFYNNKFFRILKEKKNIRSLFR